MSEYSGDPPNPAEPLEKLRQTSDQIDAMFKGVAQNFEENLKRAMMSALQDFSAHADQIVRNVAEKMSYATRGASDLMAPADATSRSETRQEQTFEVVVPPERGQPEVRVPIPVPQMPTVIDEVLEQVRRITEKIDELIVATRTA